ncbi:MAG TPA: hypothetical protein VMU01_09830 [Rhizomicrobium sp.]|nr:hypothetical protein [Rhizomicrobium sp.]
MRATTGLRLSSVAAAAVMLAGCETATTYHPLEDRSGTGYTDQQLTGNRYRVSFTGNSVTRRDVVENYLLLRAAEVTLKAGYRWFTFDTRDTEAKTTYHSDFMGWPGWRGYGRYWHSWPGWGMGADVTTRPSTRYEAYAEIILLTDDQAKNDPRAILAQDVLDHVGPMARPPAPAAN